jgi:hydrogenase-4 component E
MLAAAEAILVLILLQNLLFLGSGRLRTLIHAVAAQGVVLSLLPLLLYAELGAREGIVSAGALLLKGAVIPRMLMRALADLPIRREIEPIVGFKTSLLLGAAATAVSILVATRLPLSVIGGGAERMAVATSFATVFTGFLLLTTRRKALTQVLGYLVLENGIYIFGILLLESTRFLVEFGVLLDLFVAIFVMGIIINHISRAFTSISTERLSTLRD